MNEPLSRKSAANKLLRIKRTTRAKLTLANCKSEIEINKSVCGHRSASEQHSLYHSTLNKQDSKLNTKAISRIGRPRSRKERKLLNYKLESQSHIEDINWEQVNQLVD